MYVWHVCMTLYACFDWVDHGLSTLSDWVFDFINVVHENTWLNSLIVQTFILCGKNKFTQSLQEIRKRKFYRLSLRNSSFVFSSFHYLSCFFASVWLAVSFWVRVNIPYRIVSWSRYNNRSVVCVCLYGQTITFELRGIWPT